MSFTDAPHQGQTNGSSGAETADDRAIGELLGELASEANALFSAQVELAKVELKEEAQKAAKVGGMFSGAAVAAFFALMLLSFALAWGLSEIVPEGVAFLIVGLLWAVGAGVLALIGRQRMQEIKQPVPETIETLKEDAEWLRQQKS